MENPQGVNKPNKPYQTPNRSFLKTMYKRLTSEAKVEDGEEVYTLIEALRILMFFIAPDMPKLERHHHVDGVVETLTSENDEPVEELQPKQLKSVLTQLLNAH